MIALPAILPGAGMTADRFRDRNNLLTGVSRANSPADGAGAELEGGGGALVVMLAHDGSR